MLGFPASRPRTQAVRGPAGGARRTSRPAQRALPVAGRSGGYTGTGRSLLLLVFMVLAAGALSSRLMFWQMMQHGRLAAAAASEHAALDVATPLRGRIFDASGDPLAMDVKMNVVYAVPKRITDPYRTAALLAPVLQEPQKRVYDLVTGNVTGETGYVVLSPGVDASTSQAVRDLALPGIILNPVVRRTYPGGSTSAQTIGFATTDNKGFWGVEGTYDRLLSGKTGLRTVLRDTAGNTIHVSSSPEAPSQDGADLYLSINPSIQGLIENELRKAVTAHSADGGSIVVLDPRTGYILGMASLPSFNPNHRTAADQARFANPAISDLYEPGSTFKIVTMAAGLDTGVITPQTAFYDNGSFVIADRTLHNWNMSGFGLETMTQVLQHSANVGAAWVAGRLGTERFYRYVTRFGFGRPTGVDLQGEESGILPLPGERSWTIVNQYTNAYGQGISVTPLQVARAVAAVANGGVMMKPQVVQRVVYRDRVIDHPPVSQGRVMSTGAAHTLTDMLVRSAIGGEARLGLVRGYNIAAKTGTANIPAPNGGYIPGATIASIVGYAPAYHPRVLVLVKIDHPRDTPWGSMAAAPVLRDIFQELFVYFRIPPSPRALYR